MKTWQGKLQARIRNSKPTIEQINLSVFGFSRGAAEARAFVNWLFEVCEQHAGGWTFAGVPIRLHFLGIFDTVASVGLADLFGNGIVEGHQSWADGNMEIHPAVEQCVHFVAGHEVRGCFPLDSVRVRNKYPSNAMEVMYPGAHSDVGGGYAPEALGVSQRNEDMLARIPGYDMYIAAIKAGVPLLPWSELSQTARNDLLPSRAIQQRYNAYVRDARIQAGPVEKLHHAHMSLFFSYRFKYRATLRQRPFFKNASQKDQTYLAVTERTLNERLRSLQYPVPVADPNFDPREALKLRRDSMKAAGLQSQDERHIPNRELYRVIESINVSSLTPGIEALFDYDVHDSMAGFIDMGVNEYDGRGSKIPTGNGMGIVRFRKIFTENG